MVTMYIEYQGELVTDFKQENLAKNWMANRKDENLLAQDIKITRNSKMKICTAYAENGKGDA